MGQSREGKGHQFMNPLVFKFVRGGSFNFKLPIEGPRVIPFFFMGIGTHLTQSTAGANSFQFQRTETFPAVTERVQLVYNRDDHLSIVKSVQKLRSLTD